MSPKDLVLNIAVDLGRLSRFATEGRISRVEQFLKDTQMYLDQLNSQKVNPRFRPTLERFIVEFEKLKGQNPQSEEWAESASTWANILQHRAKLA